MATPRATILIVGSWRYPPTTLAERLTRRGYDAYFALTPSDVPGAIRRAPRNIDLVVTPWRTSQEYAPIATMRAHAVHSMRVLYMTAAIRAREVWQWGGQTVGIWSAPAPRDLAAFIAAIDWALRSRG